MGDELHVTDHLGQQRAVERAGELAGRQFGAISRAQLKAAGVSDARIRSWLRSGRLHRSHRGVYAWGRPELSTEGRLAAALLHAGPGAALASLTALWWMNLLNQRPSSIQIASPHRCRPADGVRVRHVPELKRHRHRTFPVTPLPEALLAASHLLSPNALRLVLARAEYGRLLDRTGLEAVLRSGRPGAPALRAAVDAHLPALARCANGLERDFVLLCERYGLPIPEPNERIGRYRPDMLWRGSRLIVELDGRRAHSTPAQLAADARRQSELEALGYYVVRFTAAEARESPDRIAAVIGQLLA